MRNLKIAVTLVLLFLFTLVVVQNTDVVTVRLFAWEVTMSRIVLLVLTLLIGFVIGFLTAKMTGRKKQQQIRAEQPSEDAVAAPTTG